MKPGDMFEWCSTTLFPVRYIDDETIVWSSVSEKWINVRGVHLLVSITDYVVTFVNLEGVHTMRTDDGIPPSQRTCSFPLMMRVVN